MNFGVIAPVTVIRLFNARLTLSRATATDLDTTPSVASHNALVLANSGVTSITTFDDALEGQVIYLTATNGNTTLVHLNGTLELAGGVNFAMVNRDTITLAYLIGVWKEMSRSLNHV